MVRLIQGARLRLWAITPPLLAMAVGILVLACGDEKGSGPGDDALSCPELSAKTFGDSAGDGFYRVISPNGGERFRIGDSLRVKVTSGPLDSEAVLYLAMTRNGSVSFVILPGTPLGNIDPRSKCVWAFKIPDSLSFTSGKTVSMVSDSLRIRIAKYNFESISDYSDGYFRVTE